MARSKTCAGLALSRDPEDLARGLEAGFALYLAPFLWQLIPRPVPAFMF